MTLTEKEFLRACRKVEALCHDELLAAQLCWGPFLGSRTRAKLIAFIVELLQNRKVLLREEVTDASVAQ